MQPVKINCGLIPCPSGFTILPNSDSWLKALQGLTASSAQELHRPSRVPVPVGPSCDYRMVLPKHMRPEQFFTLEESSFLKMCGLNELFVLEYVLHRWTDYMDKLDTDPWTNDHIHTDISEYIDGVTRFDANGTSSELDFFGDQFGRFMDIIFRVKRALQPYLNVVGNEYLDSTVCVITPNLTYSNFMLLEFIENEPGHYHPEKEVVVQPLWTHVPFLDLPINKLLIPTCLNDSQEI